MNERDQRPMDGEKRSTPQEPQEPQEPTAPPRTVVSPAGSGRRAAADPQQRATALAHVRALLLEAGATDEEIDQAVEDEVLDLLAVDRLLVPAARRYTQRQVAESTGLPLDLLRRFWRALGFLDVAEEEKAFTELDIEAVQLFQAMLAMGAADVETALQLSRVIGSSMARIAEAEVVPGSIGVGSDEDDVVAADAFASVAGVAVPAMARLLEFVWRRHVQAATRRTVMQRTKELRSGTSPTFAVGFADMVGFTLLSQHLNQDELAAVVRRFEEMSHDIVTGLGGRVVKMIGDEVMFVVETVEAAARIGLGLAEAYADDELLSDVRVGLASGPVLINDGDYYGPTVNLAHRIVNIANPGTVLMSDDFHSQLMDEASGEFTGHPLRPRTLKDIGRVQLWWCARVGDEADGSGAAADRRRHIRWERLAEVLRDLDELRGVGERILSASSRRTEEGAEGSGADPRPDTRTAASAAGSASVANQAGGGDPVGT